MPSRIALPAAVALVVAPATAPAQAPPRTIVIDERLVADHGLRVGDTVRLSADPAGPGALAVVGAVQRRSADPSEVARAEYRVRLHLTQLQALTGYGDRVDRFALRSAGDPGAAAARVNAHAFGFRAHRAADVAAETSATFAVISHFHAAIGAITVVAGAVFLLCIMLLKVDERRRDIAALRLIGVSRRTIVGAVVAEATAVALAGSVLGAGLGALVATIVDAHYRGVFRTPLRFALLTPGTVAGAVALSLALGVVAGALASVRLARRRPLELLGR